jgi:hypothetical protein
MTDQIPAGATSIFLHSPQHQRMQDQRRLPRLSCAVDVGTKAAYTAEIVAGQPDTETKIAEYQKQFPDARVVGYDTGDTRKFIAAPPTLASVGPR